MSNKEFRALVNEFSSRVIDTAVRILGDAEEAQDVHQEVFLAIWKRWHKFNGKMNWNAYLYRVTVRKAIESARRSKAEQSVRQQRQCFREVEKPDELLSTAEFQRKLAEHLAGLPKRQADVYVLSRIEGVPAEQVAEIMDCSQGTVRVHLHRAVKRLARELSDILNE